MVSLCPPHLFNAVILPGKLSKLPENQELADFFSATMAKVLNARLTVFYLLIKYKPADYKIWAMMEECRSVV